MHSYMHTYIRTYIHTYTYKHIHTHADIDTLIRGPGNLGTGMFQEGRAPGCKLASSWAVKFLRYSSRQLHAAGDVQARMCRDNGSHLQSLPSFMSRQ